MEQTSFINLDLTGGARGSMPSALYPFTHFYITDAQGNDVFRIGDIGEETAEETSILFCIGAHNYVMHTVKSYEYDAYSFVRMLEEMTAGRTEESDTVSCGIFCDHFAELLQNEVFGDLQYEKSTALSDYFLLGSEALFFAAFLFLAIIVRHGGLRTLSLHCEKETTFLLLTLSIGTVREAEALKSEIFVFRFLDEIMQSYDFEPNVTEGNHLYILKLKARLAPFTACFFHADDRKKRHFLFNLRACLGWLTRMLHD